MAFVLVLAVLGAALRQFWKAADKRKRELMYQSALGTYSHDLKPGLHRKDVEEFLRARKVSFSPVCCLGEKNELYGDLVTVGEEDHPWYCTNAYVYVAFEFAGAEPASDGPLGLDSDVLEEIELFRPLEGCL